MTLKHDRIVAALLLLASFPALAEAPSEEPPATAQAAQETQDQMQQDLERFMSCRDEVLDQLFPEVTSLATETIEWCSGFPMFAAAPAACEGQQTAEGTGEATVASCDPDPCGSGTSAICYASAKANALINGAVKCASLSVDCSDETCAVENTDSIDPVDPPTCVPNSDSEEGGGVCKCKVKVTVTCGCN